MAKADLSGEAFLGALNKSRILHASVSPIAVALIELAASDEISVSQLADLIAKDPSLTARMINLANSAFFRTHVSAATVLQAVAKIGVRQTRLFALSVSLKDAFTLKGDHGRFWRLSIYQAFLARWLARELGKADPEEAFTAGLTLEIGYLALTRSYRSPALKLTYPLTSLLSIEQELFGVHHREIGEHLLRSWNFPERVVACQRSFTYAQDLNGLSDLARLCAIAGELSTCICDPEADLAVAFSTVEAVFGVQGNAIVDALSAAMEHVAEVAVTFDVHIDSTKDTVALMEKANCALARLVRMPLESTSPEMLLLPNSFPQLNSTLNGTATNLTSAHHSNCPAYTLDRFARNLARIVDDPS